MRLAKRLINTEEYYFSKKLDEVRKLESEGRRIINLGIGSPDLPPSEETINALISSAKINSNHSYQPYRSIKQLRDAMSEWYFRIYGINADSIKEILPLLGSKEGIFYISMAFLDAGDKVLLPNPGYPAYSSAARLAGAEVIYYDLNESLGWYPDIDQLEKYDLNNVRLMWINYPNMPTGAKADKKVFGLIADFGRKHDILICHDNPYSMVLNDEPLSLFEHDPNKKFCLELNSFSKSFNMAGWRIGMMISNENIINAVLQVKSNVDSGMFRPIQDAAIIALQNSSEWHNQRNCIYKQRQKLVYDLADKLALQYDKDQSGMFVWAKVPDDITNTDKFVDDLLYNAGIFITPGKVFGSNGNRFVRISLCANNELILEAIKRL